MPLDFAAARQTMVDTQIRTNDVTDSSIQAAMRMVPREAFCGVNTHLAYADDEVPYAPGLALMRPRDIGKLLQAVRPRQGERALAIAAPYGAAVLQAMGLDVAVADAAGPIVGSYDVIISEAAVSEAPASWLAALAPDGRLGVVERDGPVGRARIYQNTEDGIGSRIAFDSSACIHPGFERAQSFTF